MLDKRMGRKGEDGAVETWPERYPDGSVWNRLAEATPTTLMLDERHFVILPLRAGDITPEIRAELLATLKSGGSKAKATKEEEGVG